MQTQTTLNNRQTNYADQVARLGDRVMGFTYDRSEVVREGELIEIGAGYLAVRTDGGVVESLRADTCHVTGQYGMPQFEAPQADPQPEPQRMGIRQYHYAISQPGMGWELIVEEETQLFAYCGAVSLVASFQSGRLANVTIRFMNGANMTSESVAGPLSALEATTLLDEHVEAIRQDETPIDYVGEADALHQAIAEEEMLKGATLDDQIAHLLNKQGLRLATGDEPGWYVTISTYLDGEWKAERYWATDHPTQEDIDADEREQEEYEADLPELTLDESLNMALGALEVQHDAACDEHEPDLAKEIEVASGHLSRLVGLQVWVVYEDYDPDRQQAEVLDSPIVILANSQEQAFEMAVAELVEFGNSDADAREMLAWPAIIWTNKPIASGVVWA